MHYKCTVCGDEFDGDLQTFVDHTDKHIVDIIKERHPEWIEEDGLCKKCFEYYRGEIEGKNK